MPIFSPPWYGTAALLILSLCQKELSSGKCVACILPGDLPGLLSFEAFCCLFSTCGPQSYAEPLRGPRWSKNNAEFLLQLKQ